MADPSPESNSTSPEVGRTIDIRWDLPADLRPEYVSSALVQHTNHEFFLYLGVVRPPAILGTPEEQRAQVEALTAVPASLVGAFVIPASRMPEIIALLQENLDRYQKSFGTKGANA